MASSSDDDVPLVRATANGAMSSATIPKNVDDQLDRELPSNGETKPAISVRSGPMTEMDVDTPHTTNGVTNGKRKSRTSLPNGRTYKEEMSSSEDDDKPLSKRRKTSSVKPKVESDSELSDVPLAKGKATMVKPPKATAAQIGKSDSDDEALTEKLAKKKQKIEKSAEKAAKASKVERKAPAKKRKAKKADSDDEEDDVPLAKKKKLASASSVKKEKAKVKTEAASPQKKGKAKAKTDEDEEAEAEEDEYRWWENMDNDNSNKWNTLEHNGVVFPPEYEPLPKNVKLIYDGTPVSLPVQSEEIAGFYGAMLNSEVNVSNPTFNKNFFRDFKAVLDKTGHGKDKDGNTVKIKEFEKCDFRPIFNYYDAEREKKKALPAAEKKAIKAKKDEAEAPYMHCIWDGRKQQVGNFRVEPPGLFRGRGEHPKTGMVKQRVRPEQITINIGKGAKVPTPPQGHKWKEVRHDQTGTWLAMWQENINNAYKYVMLAASSDIKGQSDYTKFEKARELRKYIDKIRKDYRQELKDKFMANRQRATAMYFIDELALRAGNEKGDDEADTVGCCSLKCNNVTLQPPNELEFDFLGKDSIPFRQTVKVDEQVFKNIKIFKKDKNQGDEIFDRLTTSSLNKHLQSYMPGLTAKVFRTYNASHTMSELLKKMDVRDRGTVPEMIKKYNDANREVAILCNHKRTVAASHANSIEKMEDKIKGLRYQQWRLKQQMLDVDSKMKKKRGSEFFELPEDLTEEWVLQHQAALVEEERQKIRKKFEKENEKLVAEGSKPMKDKDLKERMEKADEKEKKFKKENKTKTVEAEGANPSIEKIENNIEKLDQRIATMRLNMQDKDENKEVALGTSKINYIDPRLTVVFAKKFEVPIEKFFSKKLREKFDWAIKSVDSNWEF